MATKLGPAPGSQALFLRQENAGQPKSQADGNAGGHYRQPGLGAGRRGMATPIFGFYQNPKRCNLHGLNALTVMNGPHRAQAVWIRRSRPTARDGPRPFLSRSTFDWFGFGWQNVASRIRVCGTQLVRDGSPGDVLFDASEALVPQPPLNILHRAKLAAPSQFERSLDGGAAAEIDRRSRPIFAHSRKEARASSARK
jgi:hypothetical protein